MTKKFLVFLRIYFNLHRHRLLQPLTQVRSLRIAPFTKLSVSTLTGFSAFAAWSFRTVAANEFVSDRQLIEEADELYSNGEYQELYIFLEGYKESSNVNILWRIARAARDLALKSNVKSDEKKRLIYEANECSKRALELDDTNFAAHKWFAITTGDVGDYEGVKIKISNAFVIREHLEKATELNPNDATTLHCLGMWCYVFADMPGWQRTIAGFIFGTPPTSTFKEAVDFFYQAEKVDPNFYSVNLLMLGKSYKKMGDMKRAMLYLGKASEYIASNDEDQQAKNEAAALLKEIIQNK